MNRPYGAPQGQARPLQRVQINEQLPNVCWSS
jgi:hypothetical protein